MKEVKTIEKIGGAILIFIFFTFDSDYSCIVIQLFFKWLNWLFEILVIN